MVDATRRKLHIPNWYAPYLEKHRIYELFHELCRELVIQMPPDHTLFLKEVLYNASYSRYAPRIILIAPPKVDRLKIAHLLAKRTKACVITENDILAMLPQSKSPRKPKVKTLVRCLSEVLRIDNIYYTGWILPDFPVTAKVASKMQQDGILPSHVFHFIPPFIPPSIETPCQTWFKYRQNILGLRSAFKHHLTEILYDEYNLENMIQTCIDLINIKERHKAPVVPRIVLLGPRGSGRKTQARYLMRAFNIIHVDFEHILCQEWISESYLGFKLRACREKIGFHSILLTTLVHKHLLEANCLEQGWVLTGFPNTIDDFKNLDMLDTPPNRVMFLECDLSICKERVKNRRVNICTGSMTRIVDNMAFVSNPQLDTHPKDKENVIDAELNYYCQHYDQMRKYCGRTASVIEASQPIQWVSETLAAIIMRPMSECEPRCPTESTIALSDISKGDSIYSNSEMDECFCKSEGLKCTY